MKKYLIKGGNNLEGNIKISGSKNVILKVLVAACLTEDEVEIKNIPLISDFHLMVEMIKEMGGFIKIKDHTIKIRMNKIINHKIPFEIGAKVRTSSMFISPLLHKTQKAIIPNPGGCRIGARPIDRHIEGLEKMGVRIKYYSKDGYFHAEANNIYGTTYKFEKNTHTGTETLLMAAALAKGTTTLLNAAQEPEIDDLIQFLNNMGARIQREEGRKIIIEGVEKLHGTSFEIMPDRNEIITFAIASCLTGGKIFIKQRNITHIRSFIEAFLKAGGELEEKNSFIRFFLKSGKINSISITTLPHPGFMTDWQGPWSVLMTQADGISTIHESVYENRFGYVEELLKMGAKIKFYNPKINNPKEFYNFNYNEENKKYMQAIEIKGKTPLHNAFIKISDLRAGATLVLASLIAKGQSIVYDVEHLERGYEDFDGRLRSLGADIKVLEE